MAARQLDREFDVLTAAKFGGDILRVLLRCEDLLQQVGQLHFTPGAASLDVGQNFFQIAHAAGQTLHFSQALMNLLQPFAHQLERVSQPFVQSLLQLAIDGPAHLLELGRVVGLNLR